MFIRLTVLFFSLCSAFTYTTYTVASESLTMNLPTIKKSERDNRQYQLIKLVNNMTVLLVSDPDAAKSLAAVALPVGSLHDPFSQQGLAHYLEHMIFMGSQKYPQPHDFSDYLSKHAGSYNASTAATRTAYYLEVDNNAFDNALDRLSDALANPLFDKNYSDKERNAVNAEMTMARSRDVMRMAQVNGETINQSHPAAMFFGGNLETLKDKPDSVLHTELTDFYQRYYSANLMVSVLYSNKSLDELAKLASSSLENIKDRNQNVDAITAQAITDKEKGVFIHYQPVKPLKSMQIQFPIANNIADFKSKTDTYIGYLISNRSENTLANQLQEDGLIESIYAGSDADRFGNSGLFMINVTLTDKGLQQRDKIIAAVLRYIQLLKEQGINKAYYDEISRVLNLDFLYPDIRRDMSYVESLTDNLLKYPAEDVLDADYIADHYDPNAIAERLAELTPENARIWYISQNEPTDKEAYFMKAHYKIAPISDAQLTLWKTQAQQFTFKLPELNRYVSDNFALTNKKPDAVTQPQMIVDNPGLRVLHMPSYYFSDEPKISLVLSLNNATALTSAKNVVIYHIMDYLIGKSLAELQFQASVAGISFSTVANDGMQLKISGFSQYIPSLLLAILQKSQQFDINDILLTQAKSWYNQQLDAADKVRAYEQAMQPVEALTIIPYFERDERRQWIDKITLDDINQYREAFFKNVTVSMMANGNITAETTKKLAENIQTQLGTQNDNWLKKQVISIENPLKASILQQGSSTDSALLQLFIPATYDEISSIANSQVLGNILYTWFFDELRSKQQLGYAVFSFPIKMGTNMGLGFMIQSNVKGPDGLFEKYNEFYHYANDKLQALTEQELEQYKTGVISEMMQPPQTLNEELRSYINDYNLGRFDFTTRKKVIDKTRYIDKQQLIKFYQDVILQGKGLTLLSQVVEKDQKTHSAVVSTEYTSYPNASTLQQQLPLKAKQ